jgi:hypothetical protein
MNVLIFFVAIVTYRKHHRIVCSRP